MFISNEDIFVGREDVFISNEDVFAGREVRFADREDVFIPFYQRFADGQDTVVWSGQRTKRPGPVAGPGQGGGHGGGVRREAGFAAPPATAGSGLEREGIERRQQGGVHAGRVLI